MRVRKYYLLKNVLQWLKKLNKDVAAQKETVNMLHRFRDMGKTIILSAHEMPLIERSCTRIMLLKEGKKVIEGSPKTLFNSVGWRYRVSIESNQKEKVVYVNDLREIIQYLQNSEIYKMDIEQISLEDVYLHLVGERND